MWSIARLDVFVVIWSFVVCEENLLVSIMRRQINKGLYKYNTRKPHYDPNYGYEPYWDNGDWIFNDPRQHSNGSSTNATSAWPLVCGDECNYLYIHVKHVCAQRLSWYHALHCYYRCGWWQNDIDQHGGYQTFDTYCEFLHAQCSNSFRFKYIFVHVGNCTYHYWNRVSIDPYFKEMKTPLIMNRAVEYLSRVSFRMQEMSTEPFGK